MPEDPKAGLENYYAGYEKEEHPPRILYRELVRDLRQAADAEARQHVVQAFLARVKGEHAKGEFLKLRLTPPPGLPQILDDADWRLIDSELAALRQRRRKRVFSIYPTSSDEFQFDHAFYTSIFRDTPKPTFDKTTPIFGIGSCFAVNISRHLSTLGYNIDHYVFAEYINSVFGNHLLFSLLTQDDAYKKDFIQQLVVKAYGNDTEEVIAREIEKLQALQANLKNAKVIILSLGNTVDAFFEENITDIAPHHIFPRFISGFDAYDVENQSQIISVMKQMGGSFRLGRMEEALTSVKGMIACVKQINPDAHIFVTVSPVSIQNTIGVEDFAERGPVEADCASKTILRACVEEILHGEDSDRIRYFPSFEIVRWLGSHAGMPAFGQDDGSALHVSSAILRSIYAYFEYLYAEPPTAG